jgi:hypothetical protein
MDTCKIPMFLAVMTASEALTLTPGRDNWIETLERWGVGLRHAEEIRGQLP